MEIFHTHEEMQGIIPFILVQICSNCRKAFGNMMKICAQEMFFYSTVIGKVMAETGDAEIELL